MKCPVCRVALIVIERYQIELDYCVGCHGLWFDADELALLEEAMGDGFHLPDWHTQPAVKSAEKPYSCLRCRHKMEKFQMGEPAILLDRCPKGHGLWFDRGELVQVMDRYAGQTLSGQPDGVSAYLHKVFSL